MPNTQDLEVSSRISTFIILLSYKEVNMKSFINSIHERVLTYDGSKGVMLQKSGLKETRLQNRGIYHIQMRLNISIVYTNKQVLT